MAEPSTCPDCGTTHFRSQCPEGPHDWWDRLDKSKKEGSHPAAESPSEYRDNHDDEDGWDAAREQALERDGQQCVNCGCTQEEQRERNDLFGAGLHVHHIIPAGEFDVKEKAHKPNNLVTLCGSCHRKAENGKISNSKMTQDTIEADVDARATQCQCCGDELTRKGPRSRLCQACVKAGCDPATNLCMLELGDH